jgi:hypothetical protein
MAPVTKLLFSFLILLIVPMDEFQAQSVMPALSGLVRNEAGEPVSDVQIDWIQDGREIFLRSDSAGQFSLPFADPGPFAIKVRHYSAQEIGVYHSTVGWESSVRLEVLLHRSGKGEAQSQAWGFSELRDLRPDGRPPEAILTQNIIELLPGTRHLGSLLANTEASVVTEPYDIAGLNSQSQFPMGVRGSSWTQNQGLLNGLDVSHPSGGGMLLLPDLSALEAVVYTIGDSSALHIGPGAHISMISKTGGRALHGQSYLDFQCGALQNINPTARNRFFGITESDQRWRHYLNGGFQLGGPLGQSPWSYFGSLSIRDLEKRIRNHTLPVSAQALLGTFNLSGRVSPGDKLAVYWIGQKLHDPQKNASPQVTRESSLDDNQTYQSVQSSWTREISASNLLEMRLGVTLGRVESRLQKPITRQSREDIFAGYALYGVPGTPSPLEMVAMLSNTMTGAAPLAVSSSSSSTEASATYSSVRQGFWNSSHRLSLGALYHRALESQEFSTFDNVNLLFFERAPNSVRLLSTPSRTQDRIHQWEIHAAESFSLGSLDIDLGISADVTQGASILNSDLSTNSLNWTNVGGRFGVACRMMERRPLVLRAGLAQIYNQPLTRTWSASNPEGLGIRVYSWNDANGDEAFQTGENTQLLKVSGAPYTGMDSHLKNPRTYEITLGLAQGLWGGFTFHLSGFRRFEHQLMSLVNEGVPFSSYSPVQSLDPGSDGVLGSADDRYITVFNQNFETLGRDRYLLTNPEGLNGFSEGMELKLAFSARKVHGEAAMTRYRAVAATAPGISARENDTSSLLGIYDDPNKAIFAKGSTFFDRGTLGRLWVTSDLGWKLAWSMIINYQDGMPYSRYLPIKGLNQGIIGVLTSQRGPGEAGSTTGPMTTHAENIDMRLRKELSLGPGKLAAIIDVFNLANRALPLVQMFVTAPTQYWRIPLRFQAPRSLQLGLSYSW